MLQSLPAYIGAILIGFIVLIWGAERFVIGAANTALNLGVTPLIIGLTIVGLGTSAPEIIVAIISSLEGTPGLAIGNAIGSNIANIALILAITSIVRPITVKAGIVSRELPLLMLVTFTCILLLWDRELNRLDGVLLASGLVIVMSWIIRYAKEQPEDEIKKELDIELSVKMSTQRAVFYLLFSIALLIGSSHVLVWGAVGVAKHFGVSDLIIGLTIIAIGTSLPELAASIAAALKRHHELVLGNIIGSNIFNTLGVLSVPGLIAPGMLEPELMSRDIPVMTMLTLAMFTAAYSFGSHRGRINRVEGSLLLASFIAYMTYLYISATQ